MGFQFYGLVMEYLIDYSTDLILIVLIAEGGASSIPCTDTFAGPYAFSEIETQTLSNYYSSIADKITLYLSFHSYGKD